MENINKTPHVNPLQSSSKANILNNSNQEISNQSKTDYLFPINEQDDYIKYLKSKNFPNTTLLYLANLIENAVSNENQLKNRLTASQKKQLLLDKLKSTVEKILSEMIVSNQVNLMEYDILLRKIIEKVY